MVDEDAKSDFGRGPVSAANKLFTVNNVDAVITLITEQAKPVIPLFEQHKVPLLIAWDSNKFIEQAGPYVFASGFSTEKAGEAAATYAYKNLGLRNVAVIQHQEAWSDIIAPSFAEKFVSLGGKIAYKESVGLETTDYRTSISKIKAAEPDGTYFALVPPTNAQFIIQARQFKLPGELLTGDALFQSVIDETGDGANGIYFTNTYTTEGEMLTELYKTKYGTNPNDVTTVSMGYDALMKLAESQQKNTDLYEGMLSVFGPTRSSERIEKIYQIKNGVPVEVGQ